MELIEWILQDENIDKAIKSVKKNKVHTELIRCPRKNLTGTLPSIWEEIKSQILETKYKPTPVRRAYIPKSNGKRDL